MKLSFYKKLILMFVLLIALLVISYFIKINYSENQLQIIEPFYYNGTPTYNLNTGQVDITSPGTYLITTGSGNTENEEADGIITISNDLATDKYIDIQSNDVIIKTIRGLTIKLVENHPGLIKTESGINNLSIIGVSLVKGEWLEANNSIANSGVLCQEDFGTNSGNILIDGCTCSIYCNLSSGSGGMLGANSGNGGNITVKNSFVKITSGASSPNNLLESSGGFVGANSFKNNGKLTLDTCKFSAYNSTIANGAGGILGSGCGTEYSDHKPNTQEFDIKIKNTIVTVGDINGYETSRLGSGGICGCEYSDVFIDDCSVYIKNNINIISGGICGSSIDDNNGRVKITNCQVLFDTSTTSQITQNSGGILGFKNQNYDTQGNDNSLLINIKNCMVKGANLSNNSGGICHSLFGKNYYASIQLCAFIGDIGINCGGIIGFFGESINKTLYISNCYTYSDDDGKGIIQIKSPLVASYDHTNTLILKNNLIKGPTSQTVTDKSGDITTFDDNPLFNTDIRGMSAEDNLNVIVTIENNHVVSNHSEFHEKALVTLDKPVAGFISDDDLRWIKRKDYCWNNNVINLDGSLSGAPPLGDGSSSSSSEYKYLITRDETKLRTSDNNGHLNDSIVICIPNKKFNNMNFININSDNIVVEGDNSGSDIINKENPIIVPDGWRGFIWSDSKTNIEINNIHINCKNGSVQGSLAYGVGGIFRDCLRYGSSAPSYIININNCSFKGNVGPNGGGIVGHNVTSKILNINNCSCIGTIGERAGGIIGENALKSDITIIKCYSKGEKLKYSGGIVGRNCCGVSSLHKIPSILTIEDCYSEGTINDYAGGIAGYLVGNPRKNDSVEVITSTIRINKCYSKGSINSGGGGIISTLGFFSEISFCYSTGDINGEGAGGICGKHALNYSTVGLGLYLTSSNDVSIIKNCYSYGKIENKELITNENEGAIVGPYSGTKDKNNKEYLIIKNCLYRNYIDTSLSLLNNTSSIDTTNSKDNLSFINDDDYYERALISIKKDETEDTWTMCLRQNWLLKWQPSICSITDSLTKCDTLCSNIKDLNKESDVMDPLCNCKKCCHGRTGGFYPICNELEPYFDQYTCATHQV